MTTKGYNLPEKHCVQNNNLKSLVGARKRCTYKKRRVYCIVYSRIASDSYANKKLHPRLVGSAPLAAPHGDRTQAHAQTNESSDVTTVFAAVCATKEHPGSYSADV